MTVLPLLLSILAADGGFERHPGPWPGPLSTAVAEAPGRRIELRDGVPHRVDGEDARELEVTFGPPPGRFHNLTADPFGITYAAAEGGWYAISSQGDALDPLDLRDGVPDGQPLGCWLDGEQRLWVATDGSFGVLETRQFFGRTHTATDGLPAPPFEDFTVDVTGALWLANAEGFWRYVPDRGDPPAWTREPRLAEVDPEELAVTFDLAARAMGGATFRARHDLRHLRYPLDTDEPRLRRLDPGRRRVWIQAFDRDLRATEPFELTFELPRPERFTNRAIFLSAGAVAAGLLGLFVLAYRGRRPVRIVLSAGLALWIVLQVWVAVVPHGKSWPFIGFDMYTERYEEGSLLYKPYLVGVRADGTRRILPATWAGRRSDGYWQWLIPLVWDAEVEGRRFLSEGNARHPGQAPFVGYYVFDSKTRLTRRGPVKVAPHVFARFVPNTAR